MLKLSVILCLVVITPNPSQALRKCWHCLNAKSQSECIAKGRLEVCLVNEHFCQNTIRAIGGGIYYEVTKRCKQTVGCDNNQRQNISGTYPFQCDTELPHSVCRCCCGFDNCNGPGIDCMQKKPECEEPEEPINGDVFCPSYPLVSGTTCYYRCKPGFQLEGSTSTTCEVATTVAAWSNGPPSCVGKPCRPLIAPESGSFDCSDEWDIGSECEFECEQGRVLVGRKLLKCSHLSIWDHKEPTCELVTCFPPRPLDPNLLPAEPSCTDRYNYESVCNFSCHPDYDLIGADQLICGPPIGSNNKASWDNQTPRCQIKKCLPNYPGCSEKVVGDECSFSCEECNRLEGNGNITCTRDGWTGVPGTCVLITCNSRPSAPENGFIECSEINNNCGNDCDISCFSGFKLVGSSNIVCQENGEWSGGTIPAVCEPDECDPINVPGIIATCPNGRTVGDSCTLRCAGANKEFIGTQTVTCEKQLAGKPDWGPNLNQYCRDILCSNFPRLNERPRSDVGSLTCNPLANRVESDRDGREGWKVTTQCEISCNDNYQARQLVNSSTCNDEGRWTVGQLCCVECVQNTALDVVVLMDKTEITSSNGENLWNIRMDFLANFLDFIVFEYGFNLNITFVPYSNDVDLANSIDFMTIDDFDFPVDDALRERLKDIPVGPSTDSSNAGLAMKYVADEIFGFHNFRVPMIFLLTTRPPSDLSLARSVSRDLQDRNIHVRIFPIVDSFKSDPGINERVFESLTENPKYVIDAEGSIDTETNFYISASEELITVTIKLCNERAQALQPCLFQRL
ncbi:E-selectin-like [Styela clava]